MRLASFKTQQPTNTTILFTVSTQAPATSVLEYAGRAAWLLARLLLLAVAITTLVWQYQALVGNTQWLESSVWLKKTSPLLHGYLQDRPQVYYQLVILAGCFLALWVVFRRGYTEESLLVIRGLGVQTSTSSSSLLLASSTRFIPTTAIQDVFINEAFIGFQVKHYLTVVVENQPKAVVVFPTTLPALAIIEKVYRGTRACLYDAKG